jgi:2,3-bisphosphoglycerate-dependent phosphoglycerate mutase
LGRGVKIFSKSDREILKFYFCRMIKFIFWGVLGTFAPLFFACQSLSKQELPVPTVTAITREGSVRFSDGSERAIPHYNEPDWIVFYFARHCEKDQSTDNNPSLTAEGKARAERLGRIFDLARLDMVGSTNTKRALETAQSVIYWAGDPVLENYPAMNHLDWIGEKLLESKGRKIFVAGHSNTIPEAINRLVGVYKFQNLGENEFNRLFIVATKGIGQSEVLDLRY